MPPAIALVVLLVAALDRSSVLALDRDLSAYEHDSAAADSDLSTDYYLNKGRTFNCYFVRAGKFKCEAFPPANSMAKPRDSQLSKNTGTAVLRDAPKLGTPKLPHETDEPHQADSAPDPGLLSCTARPGSAEAGCPTVTCTSDDDCRSMDRISVCVCDRDLCGSVCVALSKHCPLLSDPVNSVKSRAHPIPNENAAGQILTYTCLPGYTLIGAARIACHANGNWSVPLERRPRCLPNDKALTEDTETCSRPKEIPHTVMKPTSSFREHYEAGFEFEYSCAPGYRSDSPDLSVTAVCTKGRWNMHDIVCSIVSCGHPGTPANGRHLNQNYTYNQKVSYFCNEAYNMECSVPTMDIVTGCKVRTCQANGRWSGSVPVCKPVTCPMLKSPKNGYTKSGRNTVNSVVEYFCNPGYRLNGHGKRLCRPDGVWDGSDPSCSIQDCGPPPFVPNALRPIFSSTTFGSTARYSCLEDTRFEGENSGHIICQNSGQWLPAPPRCRKHCEVPFISNGRALIGRAGGPEAKGKVQSDTTLMVQCRDDYQLRAVYYPRCDNGSWTKIPECVPKDCNDRPPIIKNGIARFYSTKHEEKADYTCYVGYAIVAGSSVLTCRFGKWSGAPPVCARKRCPWIESGPGVEKWLLGPEGQKNPWTRRETLSDNEELVKFECSQKGFVLKGHTHAICLNGSWRPSGSPRCVPQMHKQIPSDWLFYRGG